MSEAKGLIFDINENEIMSHIEDGTLSQFLESWRNTQLIKLAKEPHKVNEEDVLKFYYCESEDEYYVGRRLNTMYYAKVNPKTFDKTFCMSRYLPWGKHIVDSETLWKEHTYPSEPKEIDFSEWLKGWCNKYLVAKEPQECKWYKGINSVETCWGDIDIKTFNKFKRQGAKFCPYCGRKIKVGK